MPFSPTYKDLTKSQLLTVLMGLLLTAFIGAWIFSAHLKAADKQTISAKVIGVKDGDTITVLDEANKQLKIQLAGIDAPERNQNFGMRARKNLADKIFGKNIQIILRGSDRSNGIVGIVTLDEKDINETMINDGFAWAIKKASEEQPEDEIERYEAAQAYAKENHLGLWQDPNPIPPWEFRSKKK